MAFIPHTEADVAAMLAAIGVSRIEDLFDEIPPELRVKSLSGVPDALNEMEVGRLMSERAAQDVELPGRAELGHTLLGQLGLHRQREDIAPRVQAEP